MYLKINVFNIYMYIHTLLQVFTAATNLLKMVLTEYVVTHKTSKGDVATVVEKTLPLLVQKTGDTVGVMWKKNEKEELHHCLLHLDLSFYHLHSWTSKMYRKTSNISHTLGNKIVDQSDVVGASPVGAAPTTSSFST